jgi:hypothetical protein
MNREIKFRVWDKTAIFVRDDGTLPNGKPHMKYDVGIMASHAKSEYAGGIDGLEIRVNSERFVLMQYTGLKDKNGKEIYEGDIVQTNLNKKIWSIDFRVGSWVFNKEAGVGDYEWYYFHEYREMLARANGKIEIIGNIYEQPHLLNANK